MIFSNFLCQIKVYRFPKVLTFKFDSILYNSTFFHLSYAFQARIESIRDSNRRDKYTFNFPPSIPRRSRQCHYFKSLSLSMSLSFSLSFSHWMSTSFELRDHHSRWCTHLRCRIYVARGDNNFRCMQQLRLPFIISSLFPSLGSRYAREEIRRDLI